MISVGLARTTPSYEGLEAPFHPAVRYPEQAAISSRGESPTSAGANPAYEGVRNALYALGLDEARFGGPDWNPLGACVRRGAHVVLKPNFIRHWNAKPEQGVECVITHGAILRAVADYAMLAVGPEGKVTLAEAPQMDCDWDEIRRIVGLDAIVDHYAGLGRELVVIDLRREAVVFEDGIIVSRRPLPGDPEGYRIVELGECSFFHDSGLDPLRMRGADYDSEPTSEHHRGGRNDYLLSETVLAADLVVNLPKIKTHKKTGVTLSQKNLVGINGDKNWLPHHCVGSVAEGGDEYPGGSWLDRARSRATELARPWLQRGRGLGLFRLARRAEAATRGDDFIRAGNWHGNRTTWRMCLDLNRCFQYSDAKGLHLDASEPPRNALHLLDGIVAGENEGPLAPDARPLGAVIASTDPVAADLVAVRLMGLHEARLPLLREAMACKSVPVTKVRSAEDIEVFEVAAAAGSLDPSDPEKHSRAEAEPMRRRRKLDELRTTRPFVPHPGWREHLQAPVSQVADSEVPDSEVPDSEVQRRQR